MIIKYFLKTKFIFLSLIVMVFAFVLSAGDENISSAKGETAKLAANLLVKELDSAIKQRPVKENFLCNEMNADKGKYVNPSESKKLLRVLTEKEYGEWYAGEVERIVIKLNGNRPENVKTWFEDAELKGLKKMPAESVTENLNKNFDAAFDRERAKVCAEQWEKFKLDIYPTEEDIETKNRSELQPILLDKLLKNQSEPVFEENRSALDKNCIVPMLDDAGKQMKTQESIASSADEGGAIIPGEIEEEIIRKIESYREKLAKEKSGARVAAKVYQIFPSIRKKIPGQVENVAIAKFANSVAKMQFPIEEAQISLLLNKNPGAHVQRNRSWELCVEEFKTELWVKALEKYLEKSTDEQKSEFNKFYNAKIAQDQSCRKSLDQLIDKSLKENFNSARLKIAETQLKNHFEPVQTGTWAPEYPEIEKYYNLPSAVNIPVDEIFEKKNISNKNFERKTLFDETVSGLSKKIDDLYGEGRKALSMQMKITEDIEKEIKKSLEQGGGVVDNGFFQKILEMLYLKEGGVPSNEIPSADDVIRSYTLKVESEWKAGRVKVLWGNEGNAPLNKDTKYIELFPMVKESIRQRVKALLENEILRRENKSKETPAKETPVTQKEIVEEKKKPEEKKETPSDVPKDAIISDVTIDLDYQQGKINIKMSISGQGEPLALIVDPEQDYEKSMGVMEEKIGAYFRDWIDKAVKDKGTVQFKVVIRVFNGRIYYGIVSSLRECLKNIMESMNNNNLQIQWTDKLYKKE